MTGGECSSLAEYASGRGARADLPPPMRHARAVIRHGGWPRHDPQHGKLPVRATHVVCQLCSR